MTFSDFLITDKSAVALFKLTDVTDENLIDSVDSNHNGTADGMTTQSASVPFPGESGMAPYFDGTSSGNPINIDDVIDGNTEFTFIIFAKIDETTWTDTVARNMFWLDASSNQSQAGIRKLGNGDLKYRTKINYVFHQPFMAAYYHGMPTDWRMYTLTISTINNKITGYIGPTQVVAESALQDWAGSLTVASLGGFGGSNAGFKGNLAYFAILPYAATPTDVVEIYGESGL